MNKEDIEAKLNELEVENYSILDNGTVDVKGTVDISFKKLKKIPVRFGKVSGDFNCSNNNLDSLEGAPQSVGVSFFCHKNHLTSLSGAPQYVGKAFICSDNMLTSLEGAPQSINGSFDCSNNKLISLTGAPHSVRGSFDCSDNELATLKGLPKYASVLYCSGNQIPGDIITNFKKTSLFLIISDEDE
ncbi:MAG: hypothetical protein JSV88_01685 [Candidatus Aminicenantes bacterium]|nr:MAG: hypothetical protein JSV88_01685 [Candidatus Aminicenantes bacterium]